MTVRSYVHILAWLAGLALFSSAAMAVAVRPWEVAALWAAVPPLFFVLWLVVFCHETNYLEPLIPAIVIAVLLAILIPNLQRARRAADEVERVRATKRAAAATAPAASPASQPNQPLQRLC